MKYFTFIFLLTSCYYDDLECPRDKRLKQLNIEIEQEIKILKSSINFSDSSLTISNDDGLLSLYFEREILKQSDCNGK